jgi:hypothetical protein
MIDALAWHKSALRGDKPPIHSEPECGWFLCFIGTRDKERQYMPGRIFWHGQLDDDGELIGDEVLYCEIGGTRTDPWEAWLSLAKRPITQQEYQDRMSQLFVDGDQV